MGKIFAVIAVLMIGIVALSISVTLYEDSAREEKQVQTAMFQFAPESVDRIVIDGPAGDQARLERRDGRWVLPRLGGFPADPEAVEDILLRTLGLDRELPVEPGPDVLENLKLTDTNFERHVTLFQGEKALANVFIGAAQGPRHAHARIAGEDTAYSVAFGLFEAPPSDGEWIDNAALQQAKDEIVAIEVADLRLVFVEENGSWQLADGTGDEDLAPGAADRLADLLAELWIESILSEAEAKPHLGNAVLTMTVIGKDGGRSDYRLSYAPLSGDYALQVSSRPEVFAISAYQARRLAEAGRRSTLLVPPAASHHAADGRSEDEAGASRHN